VFDHLNNGYSIINKCPVQGINLFRKVCMLWYPYDDNLSFGPNIDDICSILGFMCKNPLLVGLNLVKKPRRSRKIKLIRFIQGWDYCHKPIYLPTIHVLDNPNGHIIDAGATVLDQDDPLIIDTGDMVNRPMKFPGFHIDWDLSQLIPKAPEINFPDINYPPVQMDLPSGNPFMPDMDLVVEPNLEVDNSGLFPVKLYFSGWRGEGNFNYSAYPSVELQSEWNHWLKNMERVHPDYYISKRDVKDKTTELNRFEGWWHVSSGYIVMKPRKAFDVDKALSENDNLFSGFDKVNNDISNIINVQVSQGFHALDGVTANIRNNVASVMDSLQSNMKSLSYHR